MEVGEKAGGREGRRDEQRSPKEGASTEAGEIRDWLLFEATVATLSFPPSHKRADEGHLSAVAPWPDNDHTHTHQVTLQRAMTAR